VAHRYAAALSAAPGIACRRTCRFLLTRTCKTAVKLAYGQQLDGTPANVASSRCLLRYARRHKRRQRRGVTAFANWTPINTSNAARHLAVLRGSHYRRVRVLWFSPCRCCRPRLTDRATISAIAAHAVSPYKQPGKDDAALKNRGGAVRASTCGRCSKRTWFYIAATFAAISLPSP